MEMTKKIIKYIQDNNLSIHDISRKTKIEESFLLGEINRPFFAGELLSVCEYLRIEPMGFWKESDS